MKCALVDVFAQTPALTLKQGRFLGRPSELKVFIETTQTAIDRCLVKGGVFKIADIEFA